MKKTFFAIPMLLLTSALSSCGGDSKPVELNWIKFIDVEISDLKSDDFWNGTVHSFDYLSGEELSGGSFGLEYKIDFTCSPDKYGGTPVSGYYSVNIEFKGSGFNKDKNFLVTVKDGGKRKSETFTIIVPGIVSNIDIFMSIQY